MNQNSKKFLRKRGQIIDILTNTEIKYQQYDNDSTPYDCTTKIDIWDARDMAEKILSLIGINKPLEISLQENDGFIIGYNIFKKKP